MKQLARMLGARVLFHRSGGEYVFREAQSIHTLSSWTMLRLAREHRVRTIRVRKRPEYWRPEQRRPGGVLTFPIGDGNACIARKAHFGRREAKAVRTVLRVLRQNRAAPSPNTTPALPATPPPARPQFRGLIGSSKPWLRILDQVWRVAPASCPVLLLGESGTGKELLARALHLASKRARGPFVAVNCGAVHRETLNSELFGHIRGAFTGADRNRRGLFREAHKGTLFLDEFGDMPPSMQVALLRALEERIVWPVGSERPRPVDVRIVAATNRDLEERVACGAIREDLYHRLNVFAIRLPPLRDRLEDLPDLARHILARQARPRTLHMDAAAALATYDWPGNVRELDHVLQAAAVLSDGDVVGPEILHHVLDGRRRTGRAKTPNVPPRAAAILRMLKKGWRSAPVLAERLGVSTRTVNRELRQLADRGLVRVSGDARARRYRSAGAPRRDSSQDADR